MISVSQAKELIYRKAEVAYRNYYRQKGRGEPSKLEKILCRNFLQEYRMEFESFCDLYSEMFDVSIRLEIRKNVRDKEEG